MSTTESRKGVAFFPVFLGLIMVLFIGIMIYVYRGATEANPVILDEHGHPRQTASHDSRHK